MKGVVSNEIKGYQSRYHQQANNHTLIKLIHHTIGISNDTKETSMKLVNNDSIIRAFSRSHNISKSEKDESWSRMGDQFDGIKDV